MESAVQKRLCLTAAALLFSMWLTGCSTLPKDLTHPPIPDSSESETTSAASVKNTAFTLIYASGDTLNPYTATTQSNLELCSLLYDGLTKIDGTMTPQLNLASSVTFNGTQSLTAVIRSDVLFSDGSAVTAADVAASFRSAKSSNNYKVLLTDIQSASASGSSVVFELSAANPNAKACLSFPVIKSGTDDAPIGCGRYVFESGETPLLKENPHHTEKPSIDVVHLLDSPDGGTALLESGSISYFFSDLSTGEIPRTSGATVNVPQNYLVYLGINANHAPLDNALVRKALSASVNRSEICANAFAGRAKASLSPFNPSWAQATELKQFSENENTAEAVAQLEQAGYNGSSGNMPSLELLVCEGNSFRTAAASLIKQHMEKVGIKVSLTSVSYSDYCDRLKSGSFDLYLGQMRLCADMSLRPFLKSSGSSVYGINMNGNSIAAYSEYLTGSSTIQQFCESFAADLPYIPLCWQQGIAAYNRALSGVTPTAFDPYYGIDRWLFSQG